MARRCSACSARPCARSRYLANLHSTTSAPRGCRSSTTCRGTQRCSASAVRSASGHTWSSMVYGRLWPQANDRERQVSLGPRLIRLRRFGCHPALRLSQAPKLCANAALCSRAVATDSPEQEAPVPCSQCDCVWYCSAACRVVHRTAHAFECSAIRALCSTLADFENHGTMSNSRALAALVEHLLARQFSLVARPEALIARTALSSELREAIFGLSDLAPDGADAATKRPTSPQHSLFGQPEVVRLTPLEMTLQAASMRALTAAPNAEVLGRAQMLVVPEDFERWAVDFEPAMLEAPGAASKLGARGDRASGGDVAQVQTLISGLFGPWQERAHTSASIVRLVLQWASAGAWAPSLREVISAGFLRCLITGLLETKVFMARNLKRHGVVSVLVHRMALHIAASQVWAVVEPLLLDGRGSKKDGARQNTPERARYSAYCAFLRPRRLPFMRLAPLLPVVCLSWGKATTAALLSLPEAVTPPRSPPSHGMGPEVTVQGNDDLPPSPTASPYKAAMWQRQRQLQHQPQAQRHHQQQVQQGPVVAQSLTMRAPNGDKVQFYPKTEERGMCAWGSKGGRSLVTFLDLAYEHLESIQLVDCARFDALTGRLVFLCYDAVVSGKMTTCMNTDDGTCATPDVLLLDAARGMQAIADVLPSTSLRRCAL
eukprot:NODE_2340_length_2232_cov_3.980048.p1 GENE.NODE_2340_length_2232_cov_3.980048~~NODE_2340_length_2232_cov_3.980048.p1  ORF type:complete len:660 (-),score=192.68 NODE_2340_length_2232_cov_3.980048:69-2048(-)